MAVGAMDKVITLPDSVEEVEQETVVVFLVEVQRQIPVPEVEEPDQSARVWVPVAETVDPVSSF